MSERHSASERANEVAGYRRPTRRCGDQWHDACIAQCRVPCLARRHSTALGQRLARPPFALPRFTPISASWLNLVERWFALISERKIKRGTHCSTLELERAIREYSSIYNEDPQPFIWTKTAHEILVSVAQFCKRISDSGH